LTKGKKAFTYPYPLGITINKQINEIIERYKGFEKVLDAKIDFIMSRKEKINHLPSYSYSCLMNEELPELKDIPLLKLGMKIQSVKTEKIWIIEEGIIIKNKDNKAMPEGEIINGIIEKRFKIIS